MDDLTDDQVARLGAARARLLDLRSHPTVQDAIAKLKGAEGSFLKFLLALDDVPEIHDAIQTISGGVDGAVSAVVVGALAPELGAFAPLAALGGAGVVQLIHFGESAIAHAVQTKAAGMSPGSTS